MEDAALAAAEESWASAGPTSSSGPRTFKGEGELLLANQRDVSMRKVTCGSGYPAAVSASAVLHEVGHTLGLGHPDQGTSVHSTTSSADWNSAVMHPSFPASNPDTPQTDDIQAIQYYYPGAGGGCAANSTTLCLNSGRFKVQVAWTKPDSTSGAGQAVALTGDTGYFWFFSSNNIEMVIKVVDGRPVNGKFWVFAGGLTNVNVNHHRHRHADRRGPDVHESAGSRVPADPADATPSR